MVPISSRLNHPDGTFAGLVLLQIDSIRFTDFYAEVPRRSDDVMSLIGLDGILRARQTGRSHTSAESIAHGPIVTEQAESPAGHFTAVSSIDGVRRLISYRTLSDYPLIVAIGVSEIDALAEFTRRTRSLWWRATVLTILIAMFAFLLVRALRRRGKALGLLTASEAMLRLREEEFRTLAESMPSWSG